MFQDLKFGLRVLLKHKGFSVVAVLTLALGIGANTAIFSVISGVLLKSLPFPHPDRLVLLHEASKSIPEMSVSYPNLLDWQQQQTSFESIAGYQPESLVLTGAGEVERITGRVVTASFFATLGVQPMLGRGFTEEEDKFGGERVAILSHKVWQQHFDGDPNLIGRSILLNNQSYTVVGVLARNFDFYGQGNLNNDLFVPMGQRANLDYMRDRDAHPGIGVIGRLKASVTIAQAQSEMNVLAARLAREYAKANADHTIVVKAYFDDYIGDIQRPLWIIQITVSLVLLIACANVANLLLARAAARRREIAVRLALGAARWRVVRQLLTESLLLAGAGAALGTLLSIWGIQLLVRLNPDVLPRIEEITIDWRVLNFTLLLTLLTGVVFGLVPALQTAMVDLQETLKDGGRHQSGQGHRLRGALVVIEVALSLLLLIGAGLLLHSFRQVLRVDPGFDPQNVLTMRIRIPNTKYDNAEKLLAFYDDLLRRVSALPGVKQASLTNGFPLGNAIQIDYQVEGQPAAQPDEKTRSIVQSISHPYHQVFGIGLLAGRYFTAQDTATSPPVVIVDEAFARKHFPALPLSEVLGKRVLVGGDELPWREIVGVVQHIKHFGREEAGWPAIYRLWSQMGPGWIGKRMYAMDLAVKTASDPLNFVAPIKREIQMIDKEQPVGNVRSMESLMDESIGTRRFTLQLVGLFALIALLLGAVGIYGVLSYTVTQRTQEIGIRLALGAQNRDIFKLIVGQGLALVAIGIGIGLFSSIAMTRAIGSLLFSISTFDPLTFVSLPLILLAVALAACWIPARRAMKVNPLIALRHD
jgi:putative ABC transport system permease protein